jgi:hypothetical protein
MATDNEKRATLDNPKPQNAGTRSNPDPDAVPEEVRDAPSQAHQEMPDLDSIMGDLFDRR